MNAKRSKLITRSLTALVFLGLSGCGLTVVESTHRVYNHIRGDLLGILPYQVEQVLPAAASVIKELDGYDMAEQKSDFLTAHILAYDKQSRKVQIDLSRTEENQTKIQIRIGTIGDKLESSMIFNYVVNKLSKGDPLNHPYSKKNGG